MLDNYRDIVTINELCEILGICKNTAYKYINSGEIKTKKVGRKIYISKNTIINFINSN